jgi:DNA-binding beta-propeller fold protein YncE
MSETPRPQPAPRRPEGTRPPAAAISAYRDALLRDASPDELARLAASLDPDIVALLDLFRTAQREPAPPDAAFVARLDRLIAAAPGPEDAQAPNGFAPFRLRRSHAVNGRKPHGGLEMSATRPLLAPRQALQHLATAVLLILLVAASLFAVLIPLRGRVNLGLPLIVPEAVETADTVLLDLTLSDIPPYLAQGGMAVTTYPPGGSSQELAANSTEVLYIAAGPMTVRVVEALQPVRVIAPRTAGDGTPDQLLSVGDELDLATGATIVSPPETIIDLVNAGSASTVMLDLLWSTPSYSTEDGGAVWQRARGGKSQDLVLPVSIILRRVTLDIDETFPAPTSTDVSQAAATVDGDRKLDLVLTPELDFVNAGKEPLDLYVLTVTNNATAATPAAVAAPAMAGQLEFLWESNGGAEPIASAYGVGVDPQGNVWVSDSQDRFHIVAPDGTFLETWGTSGSGEGEFEFFSANAPVGRGYGDVAFDAEGNIYVADTGNSRVQKFSPDRTFLLSWGGEGENDGQFLSPSGIAVGPDGSIYVSDEGRGVVQRFDNEGRYLSTVIARGTKTGLESILFNPAGLAVAGNGDVLIADYNNQRIMRLTSAGELLATWGASGSGDGEFNNPNDVAVDAQGRIYVADDFNNRVQVFSEDGEFLHAAGTLGGDPGELDDPLGVAASADGIAYVSDRNGIQAFRFVSEDGE